MNYVFRPSLEHIVLVKIAVTLWNQNYVRALVEKFNFLVLGDERVKEWQKIEDKVIETVAQLPQPETLNKKILCFIKPIGLQILRWIECHLENYYLCTKLPNEFIWTSEGTLNKKKTAELLVKDEYLDIIRRYKVACIYCLKNYVFEIWKNIPENCKSSLHRKDLSKQYELVFLWTCCMQEEIAVIDNFIEEKLKRKCSFYRYAFEYAADGGNEAATEYFLLNLTTKDSEECLAKTAEIVAKKRSALWSNITDFSKDYYAGILCFLLSQMDDEQQIDVMKNYPFEVLKCFLDWPWQWLFMEAASYVWNFLSGQHYRRLLEIIVSRVIDGYKDCDYQNLFGEFWQQSSNVHKRYIIDECGLVSILFKLFKTKDAKNIKMIFQDVTIIAKNELIFSFKGYNLCLDLIFNDDCGSLELFIQECLPSKEEMLKFEAGLKHHMQTDHVMYSKEKFSTHKTKIDKFFRLLCDFTVAMEENT